MRRLLRPTVGGERVDRRKPAGEHSALAAPRAGFGNVERYPTLLLTEQHSRRPLCSVGWFRGTGRAGSVACELLRDGGRSGGTAE
jgi:hypothetical protein